MTDERLAEIDAMTYGTPAEELRVAFRELFYEVKRLRAELAECRETKRLLHVENADLRDMFLRERRAVVADAAGWLPIPEAERPKDEMSAAP
jgi:hypothetical protein